MRDGSVSFFWRPMESQPTRRQPSWSGSGNPRVSFHFTPTSASWLNQVESFFSILTRQSLCNTSFDSKAALKRHLREYLAKWNNDPAPFVWTKKAHTIIRDHRKMLARISRTEH